MYGSNKSSVVAKNNQSFVSKHVQRASICFIFGLYQQNERLFDEIWGLNSQLVILHMIYVGEKKSSAEHNNTNGFIIME